MKINLRILALILCIISVFVVLPVGSYSTGISTQYQDKVIERYEAFFRDSVCYKRNINEYVFHYKLHCDAMKDNGLPKKGVVFAGNVLMDKHLDLESYTKYLSNLIAMVGSGYTQATYEQSSFTANEDFAKYQGKMIEEVLSAFLDVNELDTLKDGIGVLKKSYKLIDISSKPIANIAQTALLLVTATDYERKITMLNAIYDNTDNLLLQWTCKDVMHMCDMQFMYLLDEYVYDTAKAANSLVKSLDETFFETKYAEIKEKLQSGFSNWLSQKVKKNPGEIAAKVAKAASWMADAMKYINIGFDIGTAIMRPIADKPYEYYREERAMDNISDALIKAFSNAKSAVDSVSGIKKYEKICDFVYIGELLLMTHTRGEYCNLQNNVWVTDSYAEFDERMYYDYCDLVGILSGDGIYKIAEDTELGLSSFLYRAISTDNMQWDEEGEALYGYVDIRTGETVIEPQFTSCDESFGDDGWAEVKLNGETAIINTAGEHLLPYGSIDSAVSYYGGECYVIKTKEGKLLLYKGIEFVKEIDIPITGVESVSPSLVYRGSSNNGQWHVPDRYIIIKAKISDDETTYFWYDIEGNYICSADTWHCGLAGDDEGYYLFLKDSLEIYDTEGSLVEVKDISNYNNVPYISYDGDRWYALLYGKCDLYEGIDEDDVIYTNGLTTLEISKITSDGDVKIIDTFEHGYERDVVASDGVISIPGMQIHQNGRVFFEYSYAYTVTSWYYFLNGYAKFINIGLLEDESGYIDTRGNVIYTFSDDIENYSGMCPEGYFFHYVDGYWQIENLDGTVLDGNYMEIGDCSDPDD